MPIVFGIIIVGLIAAMFRWFETRDAQINEAAQKYEECMKIQYDSTPLEWHAEYGVYPPCVLE